MTTQLARSENTAQWGVCEARRYTQMCISSGSMLGQRLRRWPSIDPELAKRRQSQTSAWPVCLLKYKACIINRPDRQRSHKSKSSVLALASMPPIVLFWSYFSIIISSVLVLFLIGIVKYFLYFFISCNYVGVFMYPYHYNILYWKLPKRIWSTLLHIAKIQIIEG